MKNFCHKLAAVLEKLIGIALAVCLFGGGLGVLGYIAALIIGGENATAVCTWLYKTFYVILIKIGTITTLVTFLMIYLKGEANWVNPVKYWKNKNAEKKAK